MRLTQIVATAALTSLLSLSTAAGEGDAEYREHTMEAGIADIRNLIRRATGSGECRLHP